MTTNLTQPTPIPAVDDYFDLGTFSRTVDTTNPDAQIWFNRGLTWAYSFNHGEAAFCFQQTIAHDPTCVMGYWGAAYATGPNYNKKWAAFDPDDLQNSIKKAQNFVATVEPHLATTSPLNRAFIKAISQRFPRDDVKPTDDFSIVNKAYSDGMKEVYDQFGSDDLDVLVLYADSLMNQSPWGLFEVGTGKPILTTAVLEIKALLERGLTFPAGKRHPGLLHLYIHLMEMSDTPEAALVPADHLRDLVPEAGHMPHMPTHLDVLIGDYRRAIEGNMKASFADDKFYALRGGKNFYSVYRLHVYHSLIYAAMLAGQQEVALESTTRMEATITEDLLRMKSPPMAEWMEFFLSVRVHVLIRFGLWEELKTLPIPEDKELYCVTVAVTHYGKAIAWAATGNLDEADTERALYHAASKLVPPTRVDFPNTVVDTLKVASAMVDGEVEYRRGNYEAAFASLRQAIEAEDSLMYSEPWPWMVPARHAYAALLIEQGHIAEAAVAYAEDLGFSDKLVGTHRHPNNVWALHGYHECLVKLGRTVEAQMIEGPLKIALAVADIPIRSSCFCRLGTETRCC
ncbi:hypothetical protein FE257_006137 [Aspergillus nanangensis]|uniref:TPR domain protein n=1 Tax=Aspergillus nanangensis TaxID=2582783 RepID=A0AAD4CPA6_ASPNN|nr:hypothetical protein FE257_006137 [Aspergillus nanangensis]